jgi:hypothetical protein
MRRVPGSGLKAGLVLLALLGLGSPALVGQEASPPRKAWSEVAPPRIASLGLKAGDPASLVLAFDLLTATEGADKALVEIRDGQGRLLEARSIGKTKAERKLLEWKPAASGAYSFRVIASRQGLAETKSSETAGIDFLLPLGRPEPAARNLGGGRLRLEWTPVPEARSYDVSLAAEDGSPGSLLATTTEAACELGGFRTGERLRLLVTARRGAESSPSLPFLKTVRAEPERVWRFTWFGQSTSAATNTFTMLDADEPRFRLGSATARADGQIDLKGGKFTAFHDGISFYYTVIDPERENFELSATFTVDYQNPTPDGQEGFGLLVLDSLGSHGVSGINHYTNSAGIIATKFEETIGGVKKTSKDTLGARFVSGLTPELLRSGDSAIAQGGRSESRAFSYDGAALVQAGRSYRLTLRKSNSGYHARYADPLEPEAPPREFTLYGVDKLRSLDPDRLYLGFAVARGCNVTVGDIELRVSDPALDPPGEGEPPLLVPLSLRVESPQTWSQTDYPLALSSNADGSLEIRREGILVEAAAAVRAGVDFWRSLPLEEGGTLFSLRFTPAPGASPGPGMAFAAWDPGRQALVAGPGRQELELRVFRKALAGRKLHVSPTGSLFGEGSPEDPLDLGIALAFAGPGQEILLLPGVYRPSGPLVVERGRNGTAASPMVLRGLPGGRAILDFGAAGGGMQVWGDYWLVEGLDIRNTPGNVKGLQVGGSHCVVRDVAAYGCGDTGIQLSGSTLDPPGKWPRDNLVEDCVSHDNKDPAANNADGFAAKLCSGPGNVFRGCLAYANIDDGWDLFTKIESGPIGEVLIEDCVAFRNGSLSDGSGNGDGNGFKLGGDGIAVAHILRNSLAYANGASGITSNSNPAVVIESCTSFANKGANLSLYGKGGEERAFRVRGFVSLNGGAADLYREMPSLAAPDNYFWDGARSLNAEGRRLGVDAFLNADPATMPGRSPDGSIELKGFMTPGPGLPAGIGARLGPKAQ